ncbi:MAG: type II toxin-antitoxin system RelE/ParE family toxin, partial [Burkholderiales bacterium]
PSAADDVISEIITKALLLETSPTLGKRSPSGHRELVLTRFPFTVVYRLRRNAVVISRVLHQRRQFPK